MTEIEKLEKQAQEISQQIYKLRRDSVPTAVKNYSFKNLEGDVNLLELFGDKDQLITIHNMGQGCRYCTLWADGFNAFLPHLEDKFSVVLLSKDSPEIQRKFANSRGWRFRMASHEGSTYLEDSAGKKENSNFPGIACYERKGDQVFKKNEAGFGPGDVYCSLWHILSLGGYNWDNWTPQYNYWKAPAQLDDGGKNLL